MILPPLFRFSSLTAFPRLTHGVSTRLGGVSEGSFASLNLGSTVGDDRERVEVNTRRLAAAVGVQRDHLTTTWQVHGNLIVRATEADRGRMIAQADGIITDRPGVPLTQRYADCTPLLIYDQVHHSVGLAHGGWRGTVANVAGALVTAMTQAYASDPADLVAAIGPAIGPCCYEVGPEVAEAVQAAFPSSDGILSSSPSDPNHSLTVRPSSSAATDAHSGLCAAPRNSESGVGRPAGRSAVLLRPFFNLWEASHRQLVMAGVRQIEVAGICTRCRNDLYFSHRGHGGRTGRFAAVVMLRE